MSDELELPTVLRGEVMLLDWSETAKGGAKVVLQLDSPEALIPFRSLTLAKRGVAGQRLACIMKLLPDDDSAQPAAGNGASGDDRPAGSATPRGKGGFRAMGPKCELAVRWCAAKGFQQWLRQTYRTQWGNVGTLATDEARAKAVICALCGIDSRKELDTDARAGSEFDALIRLPFTTVLEAHGAPPF